MLFELNYITASKAPKESLVYSIHLIKFSTGSLTKSTQR